MALVDAARVAEALNLRVRRVQYLVKEGMPRHARGRYDPIRCMLWYVRYLHSAIEKRTVPTLDGGSIGARQERIRLIRAEADLREMEVARQRAQLIALSDVEQALAHLVLSTRARVMLIPHQVAPGLVGETSRVMIQAKLEKTARQALADLAKTGKDIGRTNR